MNFFNDFTLAGVYSIAMQTATTQDRLNQPSARPSKTRARRAPFSLRLPFFGSFRKTTA